MKKTLQMLCILVLFIWFGCFLFSVQNRKVQFGINEDNVLILSLKVEDEEEILHSWYDENLKVSYFFLPSFVNEQTIFCDEIKDDMIAINGKFLAKGECFKWEEQQIYSIDVGGSSQNVVFMKSANLPSLFLETESGSMDDLHADKNHEETGLINLVKKSGIVEYQGELKKVSTRGNSTFATEKKAYTFTLNKKHSLCGLDAGKKWNLLALHYENSKIHSKLIYDLAAYMGMEYTPGSTWVDLYCNGQYQGLYLLTEAITVADGRVEIYDLEKEHETNSSVTDITGGYLLEKEVTESLEADEVFFTTDICNYNFVVKSPKLPTKKELTYIKEYTQNIENMLTCADKGYKEYLDLNSFAKQFLIDKLVLNPDAMRSSTFYYKDRNSKQLKAGPPWDYDRAMGVSLPNYTLRIGDYPNTMNDWYMPLYEDEEFYQLMIGYYESILPYLEDLLVNGIDIYYDMLQESISMDGTRWPIEGSYFKQESYVKYVKYFLANRIHFLNELWGISDFTYEYPSTGEMYTINFFDESGNLMETCQVKDGERITQLPSIDENTYKWCYHQEGGDFDSMYPVFENMDIYAKDRFLSQEEAIAYKVDKLKKEEVLSQYLTLLTDANFSVCIYLPAHSALLDNEEYLKKIEALGIFEKPTQIKKLGKEATEYLLIVDNGWERIWESINGEPISELSTTFGIVKYITADNGQRQLYIQDTETNYLEQVNEELAIQFVVIDKSTGNIADVAAFSKEKRIQK